MPNNFVSLSNNDRDCLVKLIAKSKIFRALRSTPKGKSPGPNGFNVDFYLFYWNKAGDHLFGAVSHFFHTSKIPGPRGILILL